ncbi:MAG TPA: SusD/RagB family nutrient-binding outer membrane lipoprotein [Longimicrobiales bacterium]
MTNITRRLGSVAVVTALAWGAAACSDITSVNDNPNGPTSVPPPSILPAATQVAVNRVLGVEPNLREGGLWVQYYAQTQYRDEDKYNIRPGAPSTPWSTYTGPLTDFQRMVEMGEAEGVPNWSAVARIMQSWLFGFLTDTFGDIPYSEALGGDSVATPKYDMQTDVYAGILSTLKQASGELDPNGIGFDNGDLLYGGDMTKWRKFANSLRLRMAIHLSNIDPATAQAEVQAALADGVFESNEDNAVLMYLAASPNQNPFYLTQVSRPNDYGMSKTLVDTLTSLADPRLPVYASPNVDSAYVGLQNGLNDGEGPNISTISRIGALWWTNPAAPFTIQSYAEVLFIKAEAAARGWIPDDPATLYTEAIRASMTQYNDALASAGLPTIEDSAIDDYLAQPRVQYNPSTGLEQIALQKWIALFLNGPEAWTEVRRTGIPHLVPGPRAMLGAIPSRLPYPTEETVLNEANVAAAISAQGFKNANDMQTPLRLFK